ncbi:major facilitator superfamily MFS_1 [Sulfobacillus acidophilus TPY]|uniref:Major facilitator superfamily MFS_1 n=1 Tax=Sulfobacillus acidophilus (strain ATCC 700253 / DSM 10332 / NAL) TaxID=679936 RepID=G8U0Q2_SULAD|nr:major facilitator superfamily MFS_1 [Sulfobacillus acidophilus TPY]AEW05355.1 major facilitator superfamily MFS_1 [Sulfobacillus acidophilus DSM 10332]
MSSIYRQANFLRLFFAQMISMAGDTLTEIGLAVFSLQLSHHSALAFGTVLALGMLPNVLLGWVVAGVADRWNRRRVMIGGDLLRAGLVLSIPWVGSLSWAYVTVFLVQAINLFYRPANRAVLPETVPPDKLTQANSAMETASNILGIAGYGLASALVLTVGVRDMFIIDSISFVISGLLIARIDLPHSVWQPIATAGQNFWQSIGQGIRYYRAHPVLSHLLAITALGIFGVYSIEVLAAVMLYHIHRPTGYYGFLMGAMAVGMVLAGVLMERFGDRRRPPFWITQGFLWMGLAIVAFGFTVSWPLMVAEFVVLGAGNIFYLIPMRSWIQAITPLDMRGRVFAVRSFGIGLAAMLSLEGGAVLAEAWALRPVLLLAGVITLSASGYAWWQSRVPTAVEQPATPLS